MGEDQGGAEPPICRIELIGEPRLRIGDRLVALKNRKAMAMLGLLAFSPSNVLSRERIIGLLWSERPAEQARGALRQTLYDLKQSMAGALDAVLVVERSEIRLQPASFSVDLIDLQEALSSAPQPPAGIGWGGLADSLFAGFDDLDPAFQIWLSVLRQSQGERMLAQFERRLAAAGDGESLRAWALALQEADPTNEYACRRLMESDAARGDLGSAIRRYGMLWDLLDEEYGAEPSNETQALAIRLKSATPEVRPEPARAASGPVKIFVLGFEAYGIDPQMRYLTEGFRRDFLATLLPFRDWVIIEPSDPKQAISEPDAMCLKAPPIRTGRRCVSP
ncbi:AfsR/SARP family transcriptional regulator [Methylobrevis pamukkalensis]|uniref:AfsR/SARP family transcriptional regulator n=1 Tax=Methylobrevis pamukkalensis TaxID=1439726 RepID=UPI000845D51C|nr:BTAD domain-containing putative transcriptional regulator [Methylobrevis pamukkalensis]